MTLQWEDEVRGGAAAAPVLAPAPAGSRSAWPWVAALMLVCLLLGVIISPWIERQLARAPWRERPLISAAGKPARVVSRTAADNLVAIPAPAPSATVGVALTEIGARIGRLEARMDAVDERNGEALANAGRAEGMLVAFAARRALDRGASLGVLEGLLRERFGGSHPTEVVTLIEAGQQPVTLAGLDAGLTALTPELERRAAGSDWWAAIKRELGELIVVRREGAPPESAIDRISLARQRLATGDVVGARALIGRLAPPARQRAAKWLADAGRYVAARQALDSIETVALLAPVDDASVPLPAGVPR